MLVYKITQTKTLATMNESKNINNIMNFHSLFFTFDRPKDGVWLFVLLNIDSIFQNSQLVVKI
jgi:hypothetical protein